MLMLGDELEKMFKFAQIDKAAKLYEKVTGKPCGCEERKKKLNEWGVKWQTNIKLK